MISRSIFAAAEQETAAPSTNAPPLSPDFVAGTLQAGANNAITRGGDG